MMEVFCILFHCNFLDRNLLYSSLDNQWYYSTGFGSLHLRAVSYPTNTFLYIHVFNAVFNLERLTMFAMILVWTIARNYVITSTSVVYVFCCYHCCLFLSSSWCCSLFYLFVYYFRADSGRMLPNHTLCHQSCDQTFAIFETVGSCFRWALCCWGEIGKLLECTTRASLHSTLLVATSSSYY